MTPYQLKETLVGHLLLWGNAYCLVDWGPDGFPRGLWPLRPNDVTKIEQAKDGSLLYTYWVPAPYNEQRQIPQREVLHIRGLSPDGIRGYSPLTLHRESLGLTIAAEEYGARFFGNSARPGGVLQSKTRLSDPARTNLKASWNESHQGLTEAHKIAILEEGVEWKQVGLPPQDAEFINTRTFQINEVSRMLRVPAHKLSELSRATYSNIDKQEQQFKSDSVEPWLVRIEEQVAISLLMPGERSVLFPEFLMDAQWRADIRTRYEAYARGKQWGWLSTNDIRALENLNPVEGGDEYWQPVNMMEMGAEPPGSNGNGEDEPDAVMRTLSGLMHRVRGFAPPRFPEPVEPAEDESEE